jgi:hypothetical protein
VRDKQWFLGKVNMAQGVQYIVDAIKWGEAIAVSDGSFMDLYGTVTWVKEGYSMDGRITGRIITPENAEVKSAYRSEFMVDGILAIFTMVQNLDNFFILTGRGVELDSDGISALDKAFSTYPLNTKDSNFFLMSTIFAYRKCSRVS